MRRYLLRDEVASALRRGKTVECFLGRCERDGRPGVRHIVISGDDAAILVQLFETEDLGDPALLDIYEFGPLNKALEQGEPDLSLRFRSIDECLAFMDERWGGSSERLVNHGVLQNEYADFMAAKPE